MANAKASGCDQTENLFNGIDRNNSLFGEGEKGVFVKVGDKISYTFDEPCYVELVHIVFDSDLNRVTLPGDECERYHSMRCNIFLDSPKMHLPLTLVRNFEIEYELFDGSVKRMSFADNIRRMNEIIVDSLVKSISLKPQKLWGEGDEAHIFSFDLY